MGGFRNLKTEVVVWVADSKDHRFTKGWEPVDNKPAPAKKPAKK